MKIDANQEKPQVIRTVAGTTDTLGLVDESALVRFTSSSAVTVTVPLNASVAFNIGCHIDIEQAGTGKLTVAATGGVTINSLQGFLSAADQFVALTLVKVGTDEWELWGNVIA